MAGLSHYSPRKVYDTSTSLGLTSPITTTSSIGLGDEITGPVSTFNAELGVLQTGVDHLFPFFPRHPRYQLFHNSSPHLQFVLVHCSMCQALSSVKGRVPDGTLERSPPFPTAALSLLTSPDGAPTSEFPEQRSCIYMPISLLHYLSVHHRHHLVNLGRDLTLLHVLEIVYAVQGRHRRPSLVRLHQTFRFCATPQPLDTLTNNELHASPPVESRKRSSLPSSPRRPWPRRGPTPHPHRHRATRHMWAQTSFSFFKSRSGHQLILVRRLVQAFLRTCVSFATPNAEHTWHRVARFIARRTCYMPAMWFLPRFAFHSSGTILCEGCSPSVCPSNGVGPKAVSDFPCHVHAKLPGPMYLTM